MDKEKEALNWGVALIQLLLVVGIIAIVISLTPKIIHLGKEALKYYDQQECIVNILSIQLSNMNTSLKEYYLNQTINSCQKYFENNTNNGQ